VLAVSNGYVAKLHKTRVVSLFKQSLGWMVMALCLFEGFLCTTRLEVDEVFGGNSPTEWPALCGLAIVALVVPLASVIAIGNRRYAGQLLLSVAPVAGLAVALQERFGWHNNTTILETMCIVAVVTLFLSAPALFWYLTSRAGWPSIIPAHPLLGSRISAPVILGTALFAAPVVGGVAATFLLHADWIHAQVGSCLGKYSTVAKPLLADSVIFTGKVVFTGRTIGGHNQEPEWCIARIERRYVGLPWWAAEYVVIRGGFKRDEGGEYLFDTHRSRGLFTHFLPVVVPYICCHTQRLAKAAADLRVLDDDPPRSGVRVIGRVFDPSLPARHVTVLITGPGGTISTKTNEEGIYDYSGLPPGHYSLRIDGEAPPDYLHEGDIASGEVWGVSLLANLPGATQQK
jgi:hypothetical protein